MPLEKVRQLVIVAESWPPHTSSPDWVCPDLLCGRLGKMHLKEFISSFPARPPRNPPTKGKFPSTEFMPPVTITPANIPILFSPIGYHLFLVSSMCPKCPINVQWCFVFFIKLKLCHKCRIKIPSITRINRKCCCWKVVSFLWQKSVISSKFTTLLPERLPKEFVHSIFDQTFSSVLNLAIAGCAIDLPL